jgi:hypothetical protein
MSRHQQWQSTDGQIIDVEPAHGHHEHHFTIDVRKPDGGVFRRTVKHRVAAPYQVGTTVRVEIDQDNEVRFDPNYPGDAAIISTMDMSDQIRAASDDFSNVSGPSFAAVDGFSGGAGGAGGFGGTGGGEAFAAFFGGAGMTAQVIGPDGQPVPVDMSEIMTLTQAVRSGDPQARQQAIDRLRQIGYGAQQGAGGAATFISTSSQGSFGSGTGLAGASTEAKLASLQQLRTNGLLTQEQYDAAVEQITNQQ